MAGDHQINHPAEAITIESHGDSGNDSSANEKIDPESIIYDVKSNNVGEKVAATGSDGYSDTEAGGKALLISPLPLAPPTSSWPCYACLCAIF